MRSVPFEFEFKTMGYAPALLAVYLTASSENLRSQKLKNARSLFRGRKSLTNAPSMFI